MMSSVRAVLLVAVATCGCAQTVRIGVFGLFHPTALIVSAANGGSLEVAASAESRTIEGGARVPCSLAQGRIRCRVAEDAIEGGRVVLKPRGDQDVVVSIPGVLERRFAGSVEIRAAKGVLVPIVEMPLETAVASAVAAESLSGTPEEALKAQAVVTRSYYVAARGRHVLFDFCDTTHCQFLRQPPSSESSAARATAATRGLILVWNGSPLAALFTASCGGRTRALHAAGGNTYPYFAVDCPSCMRARPPRCSYCVRAAGAWPNRRGSGVGHGVGLCQSGASEMARRGSGYREILERYLPNTKLVFAAQY